MKSAATAHDALPGDPPTTDAKNSFYKDVLTSLIGAEIPFLVGGAYAFRYYTGIVRDTKDLDLFLRSSDQARAMTLLANRGYPTEHTAPHWLTKIRHEREYVDLIVGLANGIGTVTDSWFDAAVPNELFGIPVRLIPAEEMLWSKAFIFERDRFDGADINHLIRAQGSKLDWRRLRDLFGDQWPVFLAHLVMYRYVYPAERDAVPEWLWKDLLLKAESQLSERGPADVCYGTLLARTQYQVDVEQWKYADARVVPYGRLSAHQASQ